MNLTTYDMELVSDGCRERQYDFFILAPNIEKRSRAFLISSPKQKLVKQLIIADYANFHKKLDQEQESNYYDDFVGYNCNVIRAKNDGELLKGIKKANLCIGKKVGVDITGFSIPAIYSIMNMLKNVCGINKIDVYYTEPQLYVYEEGYFDSYHKNIKERLCAPIMGYVNNGRDQREILTIFLGFDGGLADLVYYKLGEEGKEIIRTIAINGFPSYTAKLKDVSLFNNEGLISKLVREDLMTTTANNPFETYNLLCKIREDNKNVLLNLCTIGSKPMALGTCLFALDYKTDVKVTYPFYEKTNYDEKEQPGKTWRYGIDF